MPYKRYTVFNPEGEPTEFNDMDRFQAGNMARAQDYAFQGALQNQMLQAQMQNAQADRDLRLRMGGSFADRFAADRELGGTFAQRSASDQALERMRQGGMTDRTRLNMLPAWMDADLNTKKWQAEREDTAPDRAFRGAVYGRFANEMGFDLGKTGGAGAGAALNAPGQSSAGPKGQSPGAASASADGSASGTPAAGARGSFDPEMALAVIGGRTGIDDYMKMRSGERANKLSQEKADREFRRNLILQLAAKGNPQAMAAAQQMAKDDPMFAGLGSEGLRGLAPERKPQDALTAESQFELDKLATDLSNNKFGREEDINKARESITNIVGMLTQRGVSTGEAMAFVKQYLSQKLPARPGFWGNPLSFITDQLNLNTQGHIRSDLGLSYDQIPAR